MTRQFCLNPGGKKVIIDEVQKYPEILSFVQIHADDQKNNGQFIITGSQSLLLSEKISQSLAGRTAILKLLPFSHAEINAALPSNLYFYRDSNKNEVDCIVEGAELKAIEIKSSKTFSSGFVKGLLNFSKFSGLSVNNGFIIYGGKEPFIFKGFQVLTWNNLKNF
jgi:predicted AAA+ superfamily ATPase